jgi:hypothetical protein
MTIGQVGNVLERGIFLVDGHNSIPINIHIRVCINEKTPKINSPIHSQNSYSGRCLSERTRKDLTNGQYSVEGEAHLRCPLSVDRALSLPHDDLILQQPSDHEAVTIGDRLSV